MSLKGTLATAQYWKATEPSEPDLGLDGAKEPAAAGADSQELECLRRENEDLRILVSELQQRVEESAGQNAQGWEERQKDYDSLLEEKSEVIRSLHQKIQELQARPTAPPLTPREEELITLSDELERERCQLEQSRRQLDEERGQLKEDEKSMMQQMREMEVSMAKERAELARQRNELQRLHSEVHHELELAARDAALRERLMPLQRRAQEFQRKTTDNGRDQAPAPPAPAKEGQTKETGLFRRLFG